MPDCFHFLYNNIFRQKNQDFLKKNLPDFAFSAFCIDTFFKKACFSLIYHAQIFRYDAIILHFLRADLPVYLVVFAPLLCIAAFTIMFPIRVALYSQRASDHTAPACLQAPHTGSAWRADSSQPPLPHHCT